jgi:S-adenosylmethionine:tRNA ribosyltransferase-isomerase
VRIAELDYELPPELIAQTPIEPRDASRLLVFSRMSGAVEDHAFVDLPDLLAPGDVLVRNDTRVIPARTHFRRATGGRLEVLFLKPAAGLAAVTSRAVPQPPGDAPTTPSSGSTAGVAASSADGELWEVLVRGRSREGEVLRFDPAELAASGARSAASVAEEGADESADWRLRVEERLGEGRWLVRSLSRGSVLGRLEAVGEAPLPPYIKQRLERRERYQTTYARFLGSAAAPTAGLHFTRELDDTLVRRGVAVESLTLHVGLGTFQPLTADDVETQQLHSEPYAVDARTWGRIERAKREGRRVIAVGTTTTRLLETLARHPVLETSAHGPLLEGRTDLFIAPGFHFELVDGLLTNFHLPRTSLLALVMAFCGVEKTRRLYGHAIEGRYRFYSFGDAMLAL